MYMYINFFPLSDQFSPPFLKHRLRRDSAAPRCAGAPPGTGETDPEGGSAPSPHSTSGSRTGGAWGLLHAPCYALEIKHSVYSRGNTSVQL